MHSYRSGSWSKWDHRFLHLARQVSTWSKDPSTQTGSVIARPDGTVASVGYNGFPRGVTDTFERLGDRPTKYAMVVHAEVNAILTMHGSVDGCTVYVYPWQPCSHCAGALIQAGIKRVVTLVPTDAQVARWGESFKIAQTMFKEAGVTLDLIPHYWLDTAEENLPS